MHVRTQCPPDFTLFRWPVGSTWFTCNLLFPHNRLRPITKTTGALVSVVVSNIPAAFLSAAPRLCHPGRQATSGQPAITPHLGHRPRPPSRLSPTCASSSPRFEVGLAHTTAWTQHTCNRSASSSVAQYLPSPECQRRPRQPRRHAPASPGPISLLHPGRPSLARLRMAQRGHRRDLGTERRTLSIDDLPSKLCANDPLIDIGPSSSPFAPHRPEYGHL